MKRRYHLLVFGGALLLLILVRASQDLWRYVVYSDERHAIIRLESQVDEAGFGVITTQLRADTLRREIEAIDEGLRESRRQLDFMEQSIYDLRSARDVEAVYRDGLADYNSEVGRRNALFESWRATVESNHEHVERYNLLADSIRALATVMGEPYYPIRSPAEIAARREEVEGSRDDGM